MAAYLRTERALISTAISVLRRTAPCQEHCSEKMDVLQAWIQTAESCRVTVPPREEPDDEHRRARPRGHPVRRHRAEGVLRRRARLVPALAARPRRRRRDRRRPPAPRRRRGGRAGPGLRAEDEQLRPR